MEQKIYQLPQMKHENILHFIGVEKRGDHSQVEYWLVTAYHERGSLCDFLKVLSLFISFEFVNEIIQSFMISIYFVLYM